MRTARFAWSVPDEETRTDTIGSLYLNSGQK